MSVHFASPSDEQKNVMQEFADAMNKVMEVILRYPSERHASIAYQHAEDCMMRFNLCVMNLQKQDEPAAQPEIVADVH